MFDQRKGGQGDQQGGGGQKDDQKPQRPNQNPNEMPGEHNQQGSEIDPPVGGDPA
jgi:hypothetical protein